MIVFPSETTENISQLVKWDKIDGAQGGSPTRKALRPQDFKSCVYSSSTTWARRNRASACVSG